VKVKVGDKIFDAEKEPILVILTESDKYNIANLPPNAPGYAVFPGSMDADRVAAWAREGLPWENGVVLAEVNHEIS
jgi:hypothetical protein